MSETPHAGTIFQLSGFRLIIAGVVAATPLSSDRPLRDMSVPISRLIPGHPGNSGARISVSGRRSDGFSTARCRAQEETRKTGKPDPQDPVLPVKTFLPQCPDGFLHEVRALNAPYGMTGQEGRNACVVDHP